METLKIVVISLLLAGGTLLAFLGWLGSWVTLLQQRSWWRSNYRTLYLIGALLLAGGLVCVLVWP